MGAKDVRTGSRVGLVVPLCELKAVCCVAALDDPAAIDGAAGRASEGMEVSARAHACALARITNPNAKNFHGAVIVTKKRANTSCLRLRPRPFLAGLAVLGPFARCTALR